MAWQKLRSWWRSLAFLGPAEKKGRGRGLADLAAKKMKKFLQKHLEELEHQVVTCWEALQID